MIEISVLITNHNYGNYLGRCLRSLINQSLSKNKYEIIVVDDGSKDNSETVYEIFREDINLFRNLSNQGLPQALNLGIKHCKGRFIVRVDADDYVHTDFLQVLYIGHELTNNSYDAVSCDYFKVNESGTNYEHEKADINPIACGVMFKSEVFEKLGYYNIELRVGEDVDLMARFNSAALNLYNINLPLYRYVQHGPSLSNSIFK